MGFNRNQTSHRTSKSGRFNQSDSRPRNGSSGARRNRHNNHDLSDSNSQRRNHSNHRNDGGSRKRRFIQKDRQKPVIKDKDELKNDLDRQMTDYWIKTGSKKGTEEQKNMANVVSQRMNQEMDAYWKKAGEKKE